MFHKLTKKVLDTVNHKDEDKSQHTHSATEVPSLEKKEMPVVLEKKEVLLEKPVVLEKKAEVLAPVVVKDEVVTPVLLKQEVITPVLLKEEVVAPVALSTEKSGNTYMDGVSFETETIMKEPIIEETIREDIVIEKQPIIHRNVEKPVIHHVQVHTYDKPAPSLGGMVQKAPIIEEVVHTTETTEVTPVIHREIAVQKVVHQEQHLNERVVEPTIHTDEVVFDKVPELVKAAPKIITENKPATLVEVVAPTTHDIVKKDALVENTLRTDVLVEVQPIVHRDVDKKVVHHVKDHHFEAPAASLAGTVTNEPIIHDSFHRKDIKEITPVIHRELAQVRVEKEEVHSSERVVTPTMHMDEVVMEQNKFETIAPAALIVEDKPATTIQTFAPVEHKLKTKDAIVDEKIRTDTLVEVQPVIARDHHQNVVHHIKEHITEAPAPSMAAVVTKAAIIEETQHTTDVEEITPVIHHQDAIRVIEKREEHIVEPAHEKLPTLHAKEVLLEGKHATRKDVALEESKLLQHAQGSNVQAVGPQF